MESWRVLQRQTFQHFLRRRAIVSKPHQLSLRNGPVSRLTFSTARPQARSLHTPFRAAFRKPRSVPNVSRHARRDLATATETSNQNLSLSQRLKKLSREYGWSALGLYLFLSALDFPFCFLAVRWLGTDRIGHWEHVIVSTVKEWLKWPLSANAQAKIDDVIDGAKAAVKDKMPLDKSEDGSEKRLLEDDSAYSVVDHGYDEASKANTGADASLWTQLALAYAIHKSFIFVRVPLTAAILPKVVKTLRSWGYDIGKRPAKKLAATNATGVNTRGSGVKSE